MRWSFWRRNASRVALEASTPDLPLAPRSPSRPQCCATRRTTDSERWVLRLSQTISHRVLAAALLSKLSRKRAKSCSVRVSPINDGKSPRTPATGANAGGGLKHRHDLGVGTAPTAGGPTQGGPRLLRKRRRAGFPRIEPR